MQSIRKVPGKTANFPKICAICKKPLTDKTEDVFAITITRVTRMKYFAPEPVNGNIEWRGIADKDYGFCSIINDTEENPDEFMCLSCYMKTIETALLTASSMRKESTGEELSWITKRASIKGDRNKAEVERDRTAKKKLWHKNHPKQKETK